MSEEWVDVAAAAKLAKIDPSGLRRHAHAGLIPFRRIGERKRAPMIFRRVDAEAFAKTIRPRGPKPKGTK